MSEQKLESPKIDALRGQKTFINVAILAIILVNMINFDVFLIHNKPMKHFLKLKFNFIVA